MDAVLKRLLDAEQQAEKLIEEAQRQRDAILDKVHDEVSALEAEFRDSGQQERSAELQRAEGRAARATEELERRSEEHQRRLHELVQQNEASAVEAALTLFISGER